ncbi:MAG: HDOD domain-containing protein, partial [Opitutales bacterium]
TEIGRSQEWGWINSHFDDPRTFCLQMGLSMDAWRTLLEGLLKQLNDIQPKLKEVLEKRSLDPCSEQIGELIKSSEACGFWTLYDLLNELVGSMDKEHWLRAHAAIGNIAIADKFVTHMLSPDRFPTGFVDADQFGVELVVRDPDSWLADDILDRCPVADEAQVLARLGAMRSFPVGESKAASFRLAADGHGSSVPAVTELVGKDPCLGALMMQAINRVIVDHDSLVEDSLQAAQLLGGARLRAAAQEMNVIAEKRFDLPPSVNWHRFWMFQYGCAQVCSFVCEFMEIPIFLPHAYWAGMYHDLGKVALAAIYPESFTAASKLAHEQNISMDEAYMKLIGVTPEKAGARLATICRFPPWIVNVMRHVRDPDAATEDRELTAIVSFSSNLCLRYHIGSNGDIAPPADMPLSEFPGWSIFGQRVFPSFDINRFGDVMAQWSMDRVLHMSGHDSYVTD